MFKLQHTSRQNNTFILFYHCISATALWNQFMLHINSYLQENNPQEQLQIKLDTVLFYQTTTPVHKSNIIHCIMVEKYTFLYRSRFQKIQNLTSLCFHWLKMVFGEERKDSTTTSVNSLHVRENKNTNTFELSCNKDIIA